MGNSSMEDSNICTRLKRARESAGLTQAEVCQKLSIPKAQTLSSYERGINKPPIDVLGKLARLYRISTDWIIFGEETIQAQKSDYKCVLDLVNAADMLGFEYFEHEVEEVDINGSYRADYIAIFAREFRLQKLFSDLYKLQSVKTMLDHDDYKMLIKKRVDEWFKQVDMSYFDTADSDLPF